MMNGILCTTDFSDASMEALKLAVQLAKNLNLPLTILYAYRLFKQHGDIVAVKKNIEEDAMKNFAILEKEYLAGTGISYSFKTEVGFISDRVAQHVKKSPVSFLVIDKNMAIRNKETFDDLVDHFQMPLLIVPHTPYLDRDSKDAKINLARV